MKWEFLFNMCGCMVMVENYMLLSLVKLFDFFIDNFKWLHVYVI